MDMQDREKEENIHYSRKLPKEVIEDSLSRRKRVVEHVIIDRVRYNQMLVPCGKKGCTKCPHGPYWYAVRWHGNKRTEIYIGREFKTLEQKNLEERLKKIDEKENPGKVIS